MQAASRQPCAALRHCCIWHKWDITSRALHAPSHIPLDCHVWCMPSQPAAAAALLLLQQATPKGLTEAEAQKRLEEFGE